MSLLGTAFVLAGTAGAIERDGKRSRNAFPKMNDKEYMEAFDQENARYGICHNLNDEKILKIAARCRVRKENGILPIDGHKKCEPYVMKYLNSNHDLNDFRHAWTDLVRRQKNKVTKKENDKQYGKKTYSMHQKSIKDFNGPTITIEITHWTGLSKNEHIQRMKDIQSKTIFGEIVVEPPILRNAREINTHTEFWTIKSSTDKLYKDKGKGHAKNMYKACCWKLGWNP